MHRCEVLVGQTELLKVIRGPAIPWRVMNMLVQAMSIHRRNPWMTKMKKLYPEP